ncbi:MAG: dephospho-CoA kinase [Bacteroidaceae bacterium]|nr:dephospho-CoA kinase [Bacteroidaceae bacterium]
MKTIGITGGIGSGKSYVSDILRREFGIPVYDCDMEAKRLTATDPEIREKLIRLVGSEVFDGQKLNKQLLADYLFANPENASKVNAIIHPAVLRDFERWVASPVPSQGGGSHPEVPRPFSPLLEGSGEALVCLESAILFESGFNAYVDKVLFVDAPEDVRLRRAMQRDTATEAQIRARMKMQQPELHRQQADFIIDNSTPDDTRLLEQLRKVIGDWL